MSWYWKVALTVSLAFTLYGFSGNRDRAAEGQEAHDALCVFRSDLAGRLENTDKILADHPDEDPVVVYGIRIPRATLKSNAANQRKAVDALSSLDCQPPPKE